MGFTLEGSVSYQGDNDAPKGGNYLVIHGHDISEGGLNVSTGINRDTSKSNRFSNEEECINESSSLNMDKGYNNRKAVLVSAGSDAFTLISQSMAVVKSHLRDQLGLPSKNQKSETAALSVISNKPVIADKGDDESDSQKGHLKIGRTRALGPSFANYFGWCTWDSFYTDLSSNRVIQGLESFKRTGVTPRFLILDDGWQV